MGQRWAVTTQVCCRQVFLRESFLQGCELTMVPKDRAISGPYIPQFPIVNWGPQSTLPQPALIDFLPAQVLNFPRKLAKVEGPSGALYPGQHTHCWLVQSGV